MDANLDVTMTSSLQEAVMATAATNDVRMMHGCRVLQPTSAAAADTSQSLVTPQTKYWISVITSAGLVPLLFVVGVPGNVLSAAVFCRQGLRERINLCLFCLALADIVVITVTFCLAFEEVHRFFIGPHNFFIVNFVGLTGFIRVSMFLSAVIAAERCFCVVSPLLAQRVLRTRTLAALITCTSLVLVVGMQVIAGHRRKEVCVFNPATNKTSVMVTFTEFYLENKKVLDICSQIVYGTVLPVIFFLFVLITTIITALKLQSAHQWRQKTSSASAALSTGTGSLEKNMVAVTRMLIATSVMFVVCFSPILVVEFTTFLMPGLEPGGRFRNLRNVMWKVVNVSRCVNSSLNFFVYFKMGSRFRQTLGEMFTCPKFQAGLFRSSPVEFSNNAGKGGKRGASRASGNESDGLS